MKKKPASIRARPSTPAEPRETYGAHPSNAWSADAGTVSFVRAVHEPHVLRFAIETAAGGKTGGKNRTETHTAAGTESRHIELDMRRAAIIVVDMQNDFCHPEGWFAQKGVDMRATRKPIPKIQKLLPAWRKRHGHVIWLNWGIRADRQNLSPTIHFKGKRTPHDVGYGEHSAIDHGPALVAGEWGAAVIDELQPEPDDVHVFKHRLSGFWDNELDSVLRMRGITTLLFVGINTDRCVFSTLQDAAFLGYDCVLLKDACSTPSPTYVSRAIHFIVEQLHGFIATADAVLTSLNAPNPEETPS
ncbi:isochorismatase family cysteine hydrolase [Pararobbsia silviterrae]|uniref:Cysteine hydrolase n=1 Tax=Pararobbsia silviterrae TaxID=1792498 RepID=A0A494Y837_9BURK|nr:isochorismatase family cysteine hydrolase [Pararobbsia silviterrae]RKP58861.1 cysteine hydrolase [Pararobbsia silviterrae]